MRIAMPPLSTREHPHLHHHILWAVAAVLLMILLWVGVAYGLPR